MVPAPTPQAANPLNRAATALLALDAELRSARSEAEIRYFAANEPRLVTRAQQIFVFAAGQRERLRVEAISAVTTVDRSSPLVTGMEALIAEISRRQGLAKAVEFEIGAFAEEMGGLAESYPLTKLLWVPYLDMRGRVIGGTLQARTMPWTAPEIAISEHIAGSVAQSLLAAAATGRTWRWSAWLGKKTLAGLAIVGLLLLFVPVSMSALAPVEVVPSGAFIVTSGGDGVVETVHVEPNAQVAAGDTLVSLEGTVLRNRLEIAEQEVGVAEANLKKARQLAFVDARGKHDLAAAETELAVKSAERDFAREVKDRSVIRAGRAGIVLFSSKNDLVGKPVAAGEKLMEIVDPQNVELNIDLPVADAIVLKPGARIAVFLDSDPLHPIEATLKRADYKARVREQQQLAFRIVADVPGEAAGALRLGVRGTAQVYSDKVSLGFYLLRRPISALRQWIGF